MSLYSLPRPLYNEGGGDIMTNLQSLRKAAGLTQKELAQASGLNYTLIRDLEQGHRSTDGLALKSAISLAKALNCKPEDLLEPSH